MNRFDMDNNPRIIKVNLRSTSRNDCGNIGLFNRTVFHR